MDLGKFINDLKKFIEDLEKIEDCNIKKVFITEFCSKLDGKENKELLERIMNEVFVEKMSSQDLRMVKYCQEARTTYQQFSEITLNNREKYHQAFKNYDILLRKTILLGRELKLKNSLEVSNLYTYLLWNGYFSLSKEHKYSLTRGNLRIGDYFTDIVRGRGVCLNYSVMLDDLLTEGNFLSTVILNRIGGKIKRDYTPDLKRNIEKNLFSTIRMNMTKLINRKGNNHACTLIQENNLFYIYDPTNLVIVQLDGATMATVIAGKGTLLLDPYMSYLMFDTAEKRSLINNLCNQENFSCPYNRRDFIFCWENNLEVFQENISLIEDYYTDIKTHLEQIANSTTDVSTSKHVKGLTKKSNRVPEK